MKRKALWAVPWVLVMVMMVGSPVWGQGVEMIDFEEHPANPPGTSGESIDPDFYRDRGVRFESGTVLQYEEGFASSGRNGLEMCYSREFCTAPFQIGFDAPQQGVTVRVGYSGTLDEPARVLMVAFDDNRARVAVAELMLEPGSPVPVGPKLAVEDLAGRITAVEVRWSDATRFMSFLVIDDLLFEPFVPVVDFAADPLFLESIESVAGEIVVTNIGNVAVSFFVTLNDPAGAFELLGTTCNEGLAPGDSCVLQVRFGPRDAGEYTTEAVLRGQDGGPIFAIPISGRKPLQEVIPTTVAPPTSAPPSTVAPTTAVPTSVAPTAAPVSPSASDGGGDSNTTLILVLLVAIGGSVWLIRRWRAKPPNAAKPSDGTPPPTPTVTVTPDEGSNEITTGDRQPVTAIRVAADPGRTTTTLTEEKPS